MMKVDMKKLTANKRGFWDVMSGSAKGVTILIIVLVVGAVILSTLATDTTLIPANSYAANITTNGLSGLYTFSTWVKVLVVAIVAGLIFLVLGGVFGGGKGRR